MRRSNNRFQLNTVNLFLLTSLALTSLPAMAEGEISYNAALVSKYLWRGFDLSNEGPVLQGGIDYEHESGFYAGAWASQYDFGEVDNGIEIDFFVGYSFALNDDFSLDASVANYQYTGDLDSSTEWKIGLVHERFSINYMHDQDLDTNYIELNGNYPINAQLTANVHYGVNDDGDDEYYDYSIFLSYAISEMWEVNLGYSSHEFDERYAESTAFAGVFVYF